MASTVRYTGPALHNGEGVTVQFTGGYQAVDWGIGGVNAGAGIYSALISPGIPVSPVNPAGIICDDFNDEIYTNETWGATAYQVSTLGSTTPITDVLFGGANSPAYANIGVAGYAAIAYLVEELHNPGNTATQDGDISAAIPAHFRPWAHRCRRKCCCPGIASEELCQWRWLQHEPILEPLGTHAHPGRSTEW